jgi:calnexin
VFEKRWIQSKAAKDGVDESMAKYDGEWKLEAASKNALLNDLGLVMKSKAKHAAIATRNRFFGISVSAEKFSGKFC